MRTLVAHWPEYVIEACCLALFMVSAAACAVLFQHPSSPFAVAIPAPGHDSMSVLTRLPMAAAMGLTAAALIYSPFGRRSGAHMNPAVTLAFFRLGRIGGVDAAAYVAAQFAGGVAGVAAIAGLFPALVAHPSVNYVATLPGPSGAGVAFAGELTISTLLMLVVLGTSARPGLARWTGAAAAMLVAAFIVFEAPLSGTSMNPARTLGSAVFAHGGASWRDLWVYFTAPPLGMLAAAELFLRLGAARLVLCPKLHHGTPHRSSGRCIFHCGHMETTA
jgi:aquaporin Z